MQPNFRQIWIHNEGVVANSIGHMGLSTDCPLYPQQKNTHCL